MNFVGLIQSTAAQTDFEILPHKREHVFTMQEVIEQIQQCGLTQKSNDDFFQGKLKKYEEQFQQDDSFQKEIAHTWTNGSVNTSRLSNNNEKQDQEDMKNPSELFININIYQKNDMSGKRMNTNESDMVQKRRTYHHSRQPSNRVEKKSKINDLQVAQNKLLSKIHSLQSELLNYSQLCQSKKIEQVQTQHQQFSTSPCSKKNSLQKIINLPVYELSQVAMPNNGIKNFLNLNAPKQIFNLKDSLQILKLSQCDTNLSMKLISHNYMKQLQFVNLESCNLTSSTFLSNYPQLLVIKMEHNFLNELEGLEQLKLVQELYVGYNRISDLKSLKQQSAIKILDFHKNLIAQLSQLIYLQKCRSTSVISFKDNVVTQHPDYRRVLLKMFPNLRGTDINKTWEQSDYIQYLRPFYEKKIKNEEQGNFSFSQDG